MELRTPYLATDVIIRLWDGERFLGIVLIERRNPPVGLALPGGFVEVGERVEDAAVREALEETGLKVKLAGLLGVYSDPKRDPRFHVASVVWVADATGRPVAGSDAKKAHLFKLEEIPFNELVFDHAKILLDFLRLKARDF
ncbi:MAG: NUDIX hydrolase [Aquificae bacterium]|nr:NUDIX hydrolase [Aquificota bacterium]